MYFLKIGSKSVKLQKKWAKYNFTRKTVILHFISVFTLYFKKYGQNIKLQKRKFTENGQNM